METAYLVYESDEHLSTSRMELRTICFSEDDAINAIVNNNEFTYYDLLDDGDELTEEEKAECLADEVRRILKLNRQITGYSIGYMIDIVETNEWL
jgi:arsenate reductase-like glutaredoxin family protein